MLLLIKQNVDYQIYIYKLERDRTFSLSMDKFEEDFLNNSHISDIKNGWSMSLAGLRTQYIRDKKINDLLK